jgi:16S rRNA A1518/A1519 N6-dimethyltransferase RsmA/KsgA/DIM1 with predicted DNA glycosylase/AP lyase activity
VEEVFQFRRKQIGGTLARICGLAGSEVAARLQDIGVDAARRPQTLTLPEWERIYSAFNSKPGR